MKRHRIFPDVRYVSRGSRTALQHAGLVLPDDNVVSWNKLSGPIVGRKVSTHQAKELILLELESEAPRRDVINRLMNYIGRMATEGAKAKIKKLLS